MGYRIRCLKWMGGAAAILLLLLFAAGCREKGNILQGSEKDGTVEIDNGIVKARFTHQNNGVVQEYYALKGGEWVLLVESFRPPSPFPGNGTQLFNTALDPKHRFMVTEGVSVVSIETRRETEIGVKLSGKVGNTPVLQYVKLEPGHGYFHIEVEADL